MPAEYPFTPNTLRIGPLPDNADWVGFPPPLLHPEMAIRLPILSQNEDWMALYKPPAISADRHPLESTYPVLASAINDQLSPEKPELAPLQMEKAYGVGSIDAVASGIAWFAKHRRAAAHIRNEIGSGKVQFEAILLVKDEGASEDTSELITCDLPIARHHSEPRMRISHKTGKKSSTSFQRLQTKPPFGLWLARSVYPRKDQWLLHAHEKKLPIPGDLRYAQIPPLSRPYNKPKNAPQWMDSNSQKTNSESATQAHWWPFPAIHLRRISWNTPSQETVTIECPLPKNFRAMLRHVFPEWAES